MTEKEIDAFNDGYDARIAGNVDALSNRYKDNAELMHHFRRGAEAAYLDHMNDFRDQG